MALQQAIDDIRNNKDYNQNNHAILQLPPGEIIISNQIRVDADGLIIRGTGTDPDNGGTKILFKPWKAYSVASDGSPEIDGKLWPGYAAFRVETREKHPTEPNYEGSINFHWKSGVEVAMDGGGFEGGNIIYLAPGKSDFFNIGDTIYVGAANTVEFYEKTYVGQTNWINQHMRTQMFTVTDVDTTNDTLTIDQPLEFDIPYSNNGLIGGTTYYSRVMPVTAVRDVGFENFYFEATLEHTEYAVG